MTIPHFIKTVMTITAMVWLSFPLRAQIAFAPPINYPVASNVVLASVSDVNTDGFPDLVINDGNILILTNNGSGVFGSNTTLTVQNLHDLVTVADLNGDGRPDLAWTGGSIYQYLTIYTNDGSGGFGSNATFNVAQQLSPPLVADLNGDGYPDIVCLSAQNNSTFYLYTNDQHGAFILASTFNSNAAQSGDRLPIAVDVNGDKKPDLVCVGSSTLGGQSYATISIFTNAGGGHFQLASTPAMGGAALAVKAMDVNNDGAMDLIYACYSSSNIVILTNNGTGKFSTNATITAGVGYIDSIATADMNGDGKPDLILTENNIFNGPANGFYFLVLTNNGNGGFRQAYTQLWSAANALTLTTADMNGDGKTDLICGTAGTYNGFSYTNAGTVSILTSVPTLANMLTNGNLTVSWPEAWTNWTLLQNTDLSVANWIASKGIINDGTNESLTLTPTNNLFFRLSYPNP